MKVTFEFTQRIGDGLFGRLDYRGITVPDVECRDLQHICHKAFATIHAHLGGLQVPGAFLPQAIITLPGGEKLTLYVPSTGRCVEILGTGQIIDIPRKQKGE